MNYALVVDLTTEILAAAEMEIDIAFDWISEILAAAELETDTV
jgi:hypothetical protein